MIFGFILIILKISAAISLFQAVNFFTKQFWTLIYNQPEKLHKFSQKKLLLLPNKIQESFWKIKSFEMIAIILNKFILGL